MKRRSIPSAAVAVLALCLAAAAGARQGTPPLSFKANVVDVDLIAHKVLPRVDVAGLLREDAQKAGKIGIPYRVAYEVPAGFSTKSTGTWESLGNGARLWRLRMTSEGALFLAFKLEDFRLPYGAELRFFSVDRDHFTGPYTLRHNNDLRRFLSPIVAGDSAVVELYLPGKVAFARPMKIAAVSHGYRNFRGIESVPYRDGRGPAGSGRFLGAVPAKLAVPAKQNVDCEIDVNCPEGAQWQDDKRAVAQTFDGTFVCTGSMVNNVREDCRNFFLTANHCVKSKGKAATLVLFWNYENSGCNTGDAPTDQTTVGTTLRATYVKSDFTLLELNADPPASYGVYHAGWSRSNVPPASGVTLHHPNNLPKKISVEFDPIEDGGNHSGGWGDDHWRVVGWDIGTTEPGSSGSGLWNPSHQIIGQLHGGVGDCDGGWDEYGKIFTSWTNGLSVWLDPDNTGATSVNGKDCSGGGNPPPPCTLGQVGDPCTQDSDCCSNKCKGPAGGKTCKAG